jgi:23S rRNA pseudouridine2605 synthase
VRINGSVVTDPELPTYLGRDRVTVEGVESSRPRLVIMLNKPRGLVTTTRDEQGRETVYRCLAGADLPWLAPVGRLDKASEGLLLFSNDPAWAARVTHPSTGPDKTYHVQINRVPEAALIADLNRGANVDGELLRAKAVRCLRSGQKNGWLEMTLDEGRNRQIRRLLNALDVAVLRLIRVRIGELHLGRLAKGEWRIVTERELESLDSTAGEIRTAPLAAKTR